MATGKVDLSCESELNKLKKSDLVNLIKELNDQLKGEVISSCDYSSDKENSAENDQISEKPVEDGTSNLQSDLSSVNSQSESDLKMSAQIMNIENVYLKSIIQRMESELSLQKSYIQLLEKTINGEVNKTCGDTCPPVVKNDLRNNSTEVQNRAKTIQHKPSSADAMSIVKPAQQATSNVSRQNSRSKGVNDIENCNVISNADLHTNNKISYERARPIVNMQDGASTSGSNVNNTPEDGFHVVSKKKRQKKNLLSFVGSNKDATPIQAAIKKAWYFIGRLHFDTTVQDIEKYLKDKLNSDEGVTCTKINSANSSACFRVGVNFQQKEKLEDPEFWPSGVIVRQYIFKKHASTQNIK